MEVESLEKMEEGLSRGWSRVVEGWGGGEGVGEYILGAFSREIYELCGHLRDPAG